MRHFVKFLEVPAQILSFLFLFQSCSVYYPANISMEQAVNTNRKVRVRTTNDKTLVFKWIEERESEYFGYTQQHSATAKTMERMGIAGEKHEKLYSYGLRKIGVDGIQAKNYATSTILTVAVSIVGLFAAILGVAAIALSNGGLGGGWGFDNGI